MANTFSLWFRRKYNLAPTDPRYLSATPEDIEAEYWAYQYEENKVKEEFEDFEFDLEEEQRKIAERAAAAEAAALEAAPSPAAPAESLDFSGDDDWEEIDL